MISTLKCAGISAWANLVRAEYQEMPGMSLTKPQMQRLWGFDAAACEAVIETLVVGRVLRQARDGRYVAFDSSAR